MIHENFLELEAKTEVFLKQQIKDKYEKKYERTMQEMTEQIFNLTNEIDGLNRRCSCLRGGAGEFRKGERLCCILGMVSLSSSSSTNAGWSVVIEDR